MNRTGTWVITLLHAAAISLASSACQDRGAAAAPDAALQALVEGASLAAAVEAPQMTADERTQLADQVRRFYRGEQHRLIWSDKGHPSKRFDQLTQVLDRAGDHGLPPELYHLTPPSGGEDERFTPEEAARFDVGATARLFRYFLHVTAGRLDPHRLQRLWTLKPARPDLVAVLADAVRDSSLLDALHRLQPSHPEYRELQQALVRYRTIAAKGGWPAIGAGPRVRPGQPSDRVPLLRQRLAIEGDLDAAHETDSSPILDPPLADALKRFQERHRIEPSGVLDAATTSALNVPVEQRIRTIELNLERWRWLPGEMPARYLVVNVPDFRLEAIEERQMVLGMRVVVGAPDNKTPIFADEMTHVVFSPYWNVPPGIAREETIPKAASDPEFLTKNNMEVLAASGEVLDPDSVDWSNARGLRIRQRPGSGNALGGVKFLFPNTFDVYLHDTNATSLFDRLERGLSHGCVRVEEPHALARYVLRDQPEWTAEAIAAAMKSGDERHVTLKQPIPVYILYKTAWVHAGGVRFLKDLYGHDANQAAKLWPVEARR